MLRVAPSLRPCLKASSLRAFATEAPSVSQAETTPVNPLSTHFKITLRRSAIGMGEQKQRTLMALGLTRRNQTVFMKHCPEAAGKILMLKELVEVENVPASAVRTKPEQTRERRAARGYEVKGSKLQERPWDA
ncbi:hypothetical protein FIBSPDRAFT_918300 [Athelia psychrophila]|uniref:Large ribosomal subunit protein uL30m n=1 Tax=Athelia psychrophila TaxID=1759441 RepID=A0A166PFV0_9AGAM|nr:hypothetical protein FIBSPDRAFT_918300 [Fibularhizoctonia sp. CBS 109695]